MMAGFLLWKGLEKHALEGDGVKIMVTTRKRKWDEEKKIWQKIKNRQSPTMQRGLWRFWRSKRDLNSRGPFGPYALSRGASSTS